MVKQAIIWDPSAERATGFIEREPPEGAFVAMNHVCPQSLDMWSWPPVDGQAQTILPSADKEITPARETGLIGVQV